MQQNIYAIFKQTAEKWPNNDFLTVLDETAEIYNIDVGSISYADTLTEVDRLAEKYLNAGYGHGHRVGLLLENRPAFIHHWLALNKLGTSIVPINPDLRIAELEYLISHSEMLLAVALDHRHEDLLAGAKQANYTLDVIGLDDEIPQARFPAPRANDEINIQSECALMYTSGTTGRPKGCILSNQYFIYSGQWYAETDGLVSLNKGSERMLTPLPLFHMNALATSTMAMITTGGCLIFLDRFHPRSWWESVRQSKATIVHYLGVMPAILMKLEASPKDTEHSVRFGFGAGVDGTLHQPFEDRFGFPLLEAWAMTETGAGACIIANEEPRFIGTNCFGKESDRVEVKLIDKDGNEVPNGIDGELLVRHAGANPRFGFFSGYLKDQEATDKAWKDDWFHTGDIVRRNHEGYLLFIDRKRNVIRRSGENIAAIEVENIMKQHEAIRSIAVTAVPDALRGDEVMALIVTNQKLDNPEAKKALAHRIIHWSLTQLAYYKVPGYIYFVNELPLTSTNKIQRSELRNLALSLIKEADCIDTTHLKKKQD